MRGFRWFLLIVVVGLALAAALGYIGRGDHYDADGIKVTSISSGAGVIITGHHGPGRIENTNSFPVRIKKVYQSLEGESAMHIFELAAGEQQKIRLNAQHGFYVCDFNGVELAFIKTKF